jgi:hypothetical protein
MLFDAILSDTVLILTVFLEYAPFEKKSTTNLKKQQRIQ